MVPPILYLPIPIAIVTATIFHEIGHYIIGKAYNLEPKFGIKRLYGIPHPAVYPSEGKKWPNRWSTLAGVVFSFGGFPIFSFILTQILHVTGIWLSYWLAGYISLCVLSLGFYKGSDWYYFRNFNGLK